MFVWTSINLFFSNNSGRELENKNEHLVIFYYIDKVISFLDCHFI